MHVGRGPYYVLAVDITEYIYSAHREYRELTNV